MMDGPIPAKPAVTPARARNVVAVSSGKGGVGKTWFAITLSQALAKAGRRVLLFDGDLGLANVDIQLGLAPKHDLGGVIAGRQTLADAVTRYSSGGFDIIAGQSGTGSLAALPTKRLIALRNQLLTLAADYDHVIIDIGAGIARTVRVMSATSGTCLVVTSDDPTSLTDAYAFIKVMAAESPDLNIRIVVNMASSAHQGERTYMTVLKACEAFLKISPPLAGIVRRDPWVQDSIRNQAALLTRHPNCDAAADVTTIAAKLMEMS